MGVGGVRTRKLGLHIFHEKELAQARVAVGIHRPPGVPRDGVEAVQQGAAARVVPLTAHVAPCAARAVWEGVPPTRAA